MSIIKRLFISAPLFLISFMVMAQTIPSKVEVLKIITRVNDYWQANNPEPGRAFWDNAAYHIGNMEAYSVTKNRKYLDYSEVWAQQNQWKGAKSDEKSNWKYNYGEDDEHVLFGDWQICFQTYIDLYHINKDKKRIARAQEVMEYQMSTPNKDYWWWADGLFMVMPVMTKLYKVTENSLYLNKLYEYFSYANSVMYDEGSGLYFRDTKYIYPNHKSSNGKKDFWARGDGWVFAALAKVLKDLPKNDVHRSFYINRFQTMAKAIIYSQQQEGYWTRSMLDPAHAPGPETSGTAFFTYGLLWGINNRLLDPVVYLPSALRAWHYLTAVALQENGKIGYVQPIGERAIPDQMVNENSTANFGVGAFLLAASEMTRIDKSSKAIVEKKSKVKKVLELAPVPSDFPVNFALFTKGNHQYVAYYDTVYQMVLASRKLNEKKWNYQQLDTKVPWDSHNYISLFVDNAGYIHLVGNMHSSPLVYFKSSKPWNIHSMQALHRMTGKEEDITTYPEFMYGPKGEVLFHYRYGRSGNGYEVFNVLNVSTQTWSRLIDKPLIDGEGQRNAYMQGPVLGTDGYYHLLWVWRETPDCSSNHTLSYARSRDLLHWESIIGEKSGFPITLKDTSLIVDGTPEKGGLINIGIKLGFDSSNRVIIGYHKYDQDGNTQLYLSRYQGSKWNAVKQTNWNYRWDFKGGGTIVNELLIDAPTTKDGEIRMGYHRLNIKDAHIVADEKTLAPLREEPTLPEYPKEMETLESSFPGMLIYKTKDSGISDHKNTRYVLRWEALSPNRDQKRTGILPQPSMLRLYELSK